MKVLTHADIEGLNIAPEKCFDWVADALLHKEEVMLPPKISLVPEDDVFFNVMPCLFPGQKFGGVKVITRQLDRQPALNSMIMLYDYNTLTPVAIMDGNWITAMRTGAVAVHAISTLARKDFRTVGFMGAGNTGRAAIKVLMAKYAGRPMLLKVLKYKDQHT